MDCIFNKWIPASTPDKVIIPPVGKTWIDGLAYSYSEVFPKEYLGTYMTEKEFKEFIIMVNNMIDGYWPCPTCFFFGYACSLCSLGTLFHLIFPHEIHPQ